MNRPHFNPFLDHSLLTLFAFEDRIELLIRFEDWYKLPPIRRYLYNMASYDSAFEDVRTERRRFTYEDWGFLGFLLATANHSPALAAKTAYERWGDRHETFAIFHVEKLPNGEDRLLLGDDPCDAADFADLYTRPAAIPPFPAPFHGPEGSDV